MLPSSFKPKSADEFIGCAQQVASRLEALLAASIGNGAPLKILLLGRPGIGKSVLGDHFMRLLRCDRWHTTVLNGTQVKIEVVEELAKRANEADRVARQKLAAEELKKIPPVRVRVAAIVHHDGDRLITKSLGPHVPTDIL